MKKTFAMVKPCAVASGRAQQVKDTIAAAGFSIDRQNRIQLTREQAEWLYREHAGRAHYGDLVDFTVSGPVDIMVLSTPEEGTPGLFRTLMGPTDIALAGPETLRGRFAEDFRRNAIHGSDSDESAHSELEYFAPAF